MLAEARRKQLLSLISRQGFATLESLADSVGVSESTIRRDLEALDQIGSIKRTHGGAVLLGDVKVMPAFEERTTTAVLEKRAIGRMAASLIRDGDTVLLDGGTTTMEVARSLAGRPVQVVTNSLPIATLLAANKETDLILIGGYVYPRTGVALGPIAIAALQEIRVRSVIMGAGGIVKDGVFNSNSLLVETERQMMTCGQEIVVVADHTKFGQLALSKLCGLDEIDHLVVDQGLSASNRRLVKERKLKLHLAPLTEETAPLENGLNSTPAPANGEPRG